MLPTVTANELKDAMPQFIEGKQQAQRSAPFEPLPFPLLVRCGLADYILNSKEGTLEDRVYGLVAGMPIDIEEEKKRHDGGLRERQILSRPQ